MANDLAEKPKSRDLKPLDDVRGLLDQMKPQLQLALPKHLTVDRLLRIAITACQNTPKLLDCERRSLLSAVMTCAQLGLEPDGVLGQAYLVPFKGRVQFIAGYKGLLTLARNTGQVTAINAQLVRENDRFDYEYGLNERLEHRPAEGDRGEITHFYAYAKFTDGGHYFEVMTKAEVDKVRDKSEGYQAFKAGRIKSTPWDSHYEQMGRKTAIRRIANYLPMDVQRAILLERAYEQGHPSHIADDGGVIIEGGPLYSDADEGPEGPEQQLEKRPERSDYKKGNGAKKAEEAAPEEETAAADDGAQAEDDEPLDPDAFTEDFVGWMQGVGSKEEFYAIKETHDETIEALPKMNKDRCYEAMFKTLERLDKATGDAKAAADGGKK